MERRLIPLGMTAALLLLGSSPALRAFDPASDLAIGKPAPEISGKDFDGKSLKLSEFRGKVVVLDFWGHW